MKASYYIKDRGETIKDAGTELWGSDLKEIAEEAAKYEWNECDGSEWMIDDVDIYLVQDGKDVGWMIVSIDIEPEFYAHKINPPDGSEKP